MKTKTKKPQLLKTTKKVEKYVKNEWLDIMKKESKSIFLFY